MEFKKLLITDREAIRKKTGRSHDFLGWEYDFTDIFLWDVYGVSRIYQDESVCIVHTVVDSKNIFYPPYLKNGADFIRAVSLIRRYATSQAMEQFIIIGLTREQVSQLEGADVKITTDSGSYDYIYSADDLINLSGKKFHSKRNLVAKFTGSYDFEVCEYSPEDHDDILTLCDSWKDSRGDVGENPTLLREKQAVKRALEYHKQLELKICEIKIGGRVEAFSVSSLYNDKVGHTVFEKANIKFDGIFQAINKFTAQKYFSGCVYVNREEDMNIEGLRRAKKSYNPVLLWEKYNATFTL